MAHILNIQSSPRGSKSASITVADAFLGEYQGLYPDSTVDTLNVFEEDLPDFDGEAIGAKYKGAAHEAMDGAEAEIWKTIGTLVDRFKKADRIVLGVPMWNFAYPYKLKQLIDLVCQRNMLFSFDGTTFGPLLEVPKALVIYTQGQTYGEGSATPASRFDHQTAFIDFWLRFIGVHEISAITVANTWSDEAEMRVAAAREQATGLARSF